MAARATGRDLAPRRAALPTPPTTGTCPVSRRAPAFRYEYEEGGLQYCIREKRAVNVGSRAPHTASYYNPDGAPVLDSDSRGLCSGSFPSLHREWHGILKRQVCGPCIGSRPSKLTRQRACDTPRRQLFSISPCRIKTPRQGHSPEWLGFRRLSVSRLSAGTSACEA